MKSEILLSLICLFTFIQTVSSSEEHKEEHIFCRICGNVIADYSDRTFVPSRGARDIRSYDMDHQDLIVDTIRTNVLKEPFLLIVVHCRTARNLKRSR